MRISPINNYQTQKRNNSKQNPNFGALKFPDSMSDAMIDTMVETIRARLMNTGKLRVVPPIWKLSKLPELRHAMGNSNYENFTRNNPNICLIGPEGPHSDGEGDTIFHAALNALKQAENFAKRAIERERTEGPLTPERLDSLTDIELINLIKPDREGILPTITE